MWINLWSTLHLNIPHIRADDIDRYGSSRTYNLLSLFSCSCIEKALSTCNAYCVNSSNKHRTIKLCLHGNFSLRNVLWTQDLGYNIILNLDQMKIKILYRPLNKTLIGINEVDEVQLYSFLNAFPFLIYLRRHQSSVS